MDILTQLPTVGTTKVRVPVNWLHSEHYGICTNGQSMDDFRNWHWSMEGSIVTAAHLTVFFLPISIID